jgi:hypothetical protein
MNSTRNMFAEWDNSCLRWYLDPELLHKDYWCQTHAERDALIDCVFDAAQHFVLEYDFSVVND